MLPSVCHLHACVAGSGGDRVSLSELQELVRRGGRASLLLAYEPCGFEDAFASAGVDGLLAVRGRDLSAEETRRSAADVLPEAVAFLRERAVQVLHCHNLGVLPQARLLARDLGIPLVITVHLLGDKWERWRYSWKSRRRAQFRLIREAFASATVLTVARNMEAELSRLGLRSGRLVNLTNPIHEAFWAGPTAPEGFDILVVGRPSRQKDPAFSRQILDRVKRSRPSLRIGWLGATGDEGAFRGTERWAPGLEFLGRRAPEEAAELMRASKVLLLASEREGNPLVVGEALLCGMRLALSDIPVHREHYREVAKLFRRRDAIAAEVAVLEALDDSPPSRAQVATIGLLTADQHADRLFEIYASLNHR